MLSPRYQITNALLESISKIDAARAVIESAPLVPEYERSFQEDAMARTVHYSTMIEEEAYRLKLEDAKKVVRGEVLSTFRKRDVREIINYRAAVELINSLKDVPLDLSLLLNIHRILMEGILAEKYVGSLRKTKVVGVSSKTHEVVFEPPQPSQVEDLLNEFFLWYEGDKKVHPIVRAGIVHYEISRIHPFVDGNGRVSRLMATFSLYKDDYDIQRFFALEEYYDQNLEKYYDALDSVEETGELTTWLEFFAYGLSEELAGIKDRVLKMSRDYKNRQKLGQIRLSDRQMEIVDFIQEHGKIQNKDWQKLLSKVSDDTVLRDLKDLMDKKVIVKKGRTKSARYELI